MYFEDERGLLNWLSFNHGQNLGPNVDMTSVKYRKTKICSSKYVIKWNIFRKMTYRYKYLAHLGFVRTHLDHFFDWNQCTAVLANHKYVKQLPEYWNEDPSRRILPKYFFQRPCLCFEDVLERSLSLFSCASSCWVLLI